MRNEDNVLQRNIYKLYAIDFFANSIFTLPINLLFGREFLGLSYLTAGSLIFVNRLTSIIFDFLGGVVADRVGRKQANIYGLAIQVICFIPFLLTKSYLVLLASVAISGIGFALSSNSIDALIYEEASELGKQEAYQRANATTWGFLYAGRFYASLLGGLTFVIDPRLPYLLTMISLAIALIACMQIKIRKQIDKFTKPTYGELIKSALRVYRSNPELTKFALIGGLFSLWGNMLFGYYQPFFVNLNVSTSTLGVLFAFISLGSAMGSLLMRRLPNTISAHAIHSIELSGVIATAFLLATLHLPTILVAPLILSLMSGFQYPNMRLFVNGQTDNHARASVLSFATSILNLGLVIGLAGSYYMADHFSKNIILNVVILGAALSVLANHLIPISKKTSLTTES